MSKIKSFKEFINESLFGKMSDKGRGETVKKEDDINLLDGEGMVEYLKKIYEIKNTGFIIYVDINGIITIPIFEYILGRVYKDFIKYDSVEKRVYVWENFAPDDELMDKIEREYKTSKYNTEFSKNIQISPKTGETTNKFLIEVIDFMLKNANVFYHRLLTKITNESLFGDMSNKGRGETVKKEDEIVSNIKELKPVDMGGSVLWADKDLESNDNVYFSFPDANNIIKNSGWRLPTFKEVAELNKMTAIYKNTQEEYKLHYYDTTHNDLIFKKCGFQYADDDGMLHAYGTYYAWTSDVSKSGNEAYQTIRIGRYLSSTPMHYANRCCVRLVKDK